MNSNYAHPNPHPDQISIFSTHFTKSHILDGIDGMGCIRFNVTIVMLNLDGDADPTSPVYVVTLSLIKHPEVLPPSYPMRLLGPRVRSRQW